jgi:3D (Asp-Asp-Asp) domain-containing protein
MHLGTRLLPVLAIGALAAACSGATEGQELGETHDEVRATSSFVSRGTGYYPDSSALEGGFVDRRGVRLRTLQQFLAGQATYVSVAMDVNAFKYGQRLRIRELEQKYGRSIVFRVVDTGGAFRGRGRSRIDICTANRSASLDSTINGTLHIDVMDESLPPAQPPADGPGNDENGSGSANGGEPADNGNSGGTPCTNDGACNPGNDGSGLICVNRTCVPGCRSNAQCPGVKSCVAGQCR